MCLTKVYYNTYSDGAQDITEKTYPCREGRGCSSPDVRRYDRKFPFTKLGDVQPESYRSLSERKPTPYRPGHKSPSPSDRRDSGVYMSGGKPGKHRDYDYRDSYSSYDHYDHRRSSRNNPRDRYDRDRDREPRFKRSSTTPHIIYADRDGKSPTSRSRSRSSSRDIPIGLVPLAEEYARRRHDSRSRSRDSSDRHSYHTYPPSHRRRTDDPQSYLLFSDQDERRRQRRERRASFADGGLASSSSGAARDLPGIDSYDAHQRYTPGRRASTAATVVHNHHHHGSPDPSLSSGGASSSFSGRKQLRWEDQVRARRERHNAEIASRYLVPGSGYGEVKGILKHAGDGKGKGKGREVDDIAELRRAVERMEIPVSRGRDRDGWGRYEGRSRREKGYEEGRYRY
ncbi:hypothetical protein VTI74DRAFT_2427 [Chaetomium olivicolor]